MRKLRDQGYRIDLQEASTALTDPDAKIRRSPKGSTARPKAAPLAGAGLSGVRCPVSVTLTYFGGSEPWVEVSYYQGKFFVLGTGSVLSLIERIQHGGFPLSPPPERRTSWRDRKRR